MGFTDQIKKTTLRTAFNYLEKNPEENAPKLLDWVDRLAGDGPDSFPTQRAAFRQVLADPQNNMYQLIMSVLNDIDKDVLKATFEHSVGNFAGPNLCLQPALHRLLGC